MTVTDDASIAQEPATLRYGPAIFVGTFALCIVAFLLQAYLQFDRKTEAGAGLCGLVEYKEAVARSVTGPKLLLVGGSGTTLGFRASQIEATTGITTRNFGLQGSLGPNLTLARATEVLRPGDSVLLVPEYSQYAYDRPAAAAIDVYLGCGKTQFAALNLGQQVQFLLGVSPVRWTELITPRVSRVPDTLDRFGDRRREDAAWPKISDAELRRLNAYQPFDIRFDPESDGVRSIERFVTMARSRDIHVMATWPNTIRSESYLKDPDVRQIASFYERLGVPMIGRPELGLYGIEAFYDTQYHMNREGITRRTADFIRALEASGATCQMRHDAPCPKAAERNKASAG